VHPGHIHFSYVATEVHQDILISPRTIANYTYTVAVWNQDQNSIGQGAIADQYGIGLIFYDANDNVIHQDSFLSTEVHSWRDVTLQGNNPNPNTPVAKVRIVVAGHDRGFWQGTYGPAMMNVRLQLGWITGSTQGSTTTGTMQVSINEGGETTFVAPNGGIFVSSNLRYEAIDDSSCGTDISPNNLGGNVIQLVADNSLWGDPCGGSYKRIVGTLTYSSSEPQFIKDPSLLLVVQSSEANLTSAQQAEQIAQQNLAAATAAASTSNEAAQDKEDELTAAQTSYEEALATFNTEEADLTNLENTSIIKRTSYEASLKVYETSGSSFTAAQTSFDKVSSDVDSSKGDYDSALENFQEAETTFNDSDADLISAQTDVEKAQDEVDIAQDELDSIPKYVPEEPKEPEIVKLPPLEDLTKVNFEEIKATDLTSAQAEQLKEAALQTFETATQGSPEYNAALEALFVAAQQDDIVVDPALAAIPGLGQAAEAAAAVINLLSNVGADISPEAREDAQQATVAAVIVGQVAQAAMATAMMRRP
jgi:tetratricopeptide (TPR) repeat protein